MIPRYTPTYGVQDIIEAVRICRRADPLQCLRRGLRSYFGAKHVFLYGSARGALTALLRACGQQGRVLAPAYTCIAVVEAIRNAGCAPALTDIDLASLNMTAETLQAAIEPGVSVALVTHQFGVPCAMEAILEVCRRHRLLVVEDAAAALGARYRGQLVGTFGDAAVISFHQTKVISAGGGGALLTSNDEIAAAIAEPERPTGPSHNWWLTAVQLTGWLAATRPGVYRALRFAYERLRGTATFEVVPLGKTVREDRLAPIRPLSAALAAVQLERLDSNLARRSALAEIYAEGLAGHPSIALPEAPPQASPSWIQYSVRDAGHRRLYGHMLRQGVDLSWTFRYCCADSLGLPGFAHAQTAARTTLGLPTYPALSPDDARLICAMARDYRP